MVPGSTLYLPVFNEGGGFSVGDGHGVQGDGEVCVTAIETALAGTFEIHVRKDLGFDYPAGETPSHLIAMGMDPDLDTAARDALRRMIERVVRATGLSRSRAFMLMSLMADVHVTNLIRLANRSESGDAPVHDRSSKSAVGVRSAYADSNIGTHRSLCLNRREIVSTSSAYTTAERR